jgi:hypothetical protein
MRPAWSVIWFTTLLGCAQGIVVALALAGLGAPALDPAVLRDTLALAFGLGAVALGCSFAHLGQPLRAWRAAAMWRTSWLSREVMAVSAFLALTLAGALSVDRTGAWPGWLQALSVLEALLRRPGVILSRAQLEEKLYGWKDEISSNAVEVYVHSLRKKLGADFIRNIRGMGYVIARDEAGGDDGQAA